NAQRNLNTSQSSMQVALQRLSSGLRVNSAKDDAAGLAIASRMESQVRGMNMAVRNANDGISLAQTAEGALGKVGDMLQRMRELAVQSANATNNADDRSALNAEVTQLKQEIQRVAETTNFNGTKLLDGSFTAKNFQVGANSGDTITVASLANAQTANIGSTTYATDTLAVGTATNLDAVTAGNITIQDAAGNAVSIGALGTATSPAERLGQIAAGINNVSGQTGVNAFISDTGALTLTSKNTIQADAIAVDGTQVADLAALGLTTNAGVTAAASAGINDLDVSSYAGAALALEQIDSALNTINSSRGDLGALQSRFENAVSNIQIQAENLSAARGRIVDADFAKETSNLSRSQILQQAGTAMVAQANQAPQGVLSLLR
ncbi:MAG: flagellin, partial [Hydrogenophaga sp.]|uniref:flagellin n=1 Tax=Hydrogenophaga sp. TaxID=1904254 RepID=UPI002AB9EDAD